MDDLDAVFIRARLNDKWGSYSLREILDKAHGVEIVKWFELLILNSFIGLSEAELITEDHVRTMVSFLEHNGRTIYRVKEE